ncbi:MAG: hypothetical protein DRP87_01475 [Spirochaetes bacterium]|nr:MAG: hypothetical protein DRP87_01475 [Spirochaetota bacterium]
MKRKVGISSLVIMFFFCTGSFTNGDELLQAGKLEEKGYIEESAKYYRAWLYSHQNDPRFLETLHHYVKIEPDPTRLITEIKKLIPMVSEVKERMKLLKQLAVLEELLGLIDEAQYHYQMAYNTVPESEDFSSLFSSARLLYELGEHEKAEKQARILLEKCREGEMLLKAKALLLHIYFALQNTEKVYELLSSINLQEREELLSPEVLISVYNIAINLGEEEVAAEAKKLLKELFPASPEYAITLEGSWEADIEAYPSLSRLLSNAITPSGETEEKESSGRVRIQIGSFLKQENAELMVREAKKAGLSMEIVTSNHDGKTYYRVVTPVMSQDSVNEQTILLKEKGFESFLLFLD